MDVLKEFEKWKEKHFPNVDPGMADAMYKAWEEAWYLGIDTTNDMDPCEIKGIFDLDE
jgi:hypothetical protein